MSTRENLKLSSSSIIIRQQRQRVQDTQTKQKMSQPGLFGMAFKAGVTGALAGVGSMVWKGETLNHVIPIGGMNISAPVAVGAAAAAGSVTADLAHTYVFPHIPGNDKFGRIESAALGISSSGLGCMGVMNYFGGSGESSMDSFILGAASYVGGDYISEKVYPTFGSSVNLF